MSTSQANAYPKLIIQSEDYPARIRLTPVKTDHQDTEQGIAYKLEFNITEYPCPCEVLKDRTKQDGIEWLFSLATKFFSVDTAYDHIQVISKDNLYLSSAFIRRLVEKSQPETSKEDKIIIVCQSTYTVAKSADDPYDRGSETLRFSIQQLSNRCSAQNGRFFPSEAEVINIDSDDEEPSPQPGIKD